jgi:integrase
VSRTATAHAYGPFVHGRRWRVVTVAADGTRGRRSFATRGEAEEYRRAFLEATENRTVEIAIHGFLDYLRRDRGAAESSIVTNRHRLHALLQVGLGKSDRLLATLTPSACRELYAQRSRTVKPDTHRGELILASKFTAWCHEQGWLPSNPFDGVKPVGRKSHGKPQLRVDESRKLLAVLTADESPDATAVMMALLMGLRAHEIVERIGRDLDDAGRLLWISKSKTLAGVRQVVVPPELRARLAALAEGKPLDARIFGEMTRYALHYHVKRYCRLAEVPIVPPHGLRGTFATLAVTAELNGGASTSTASVARTIGHSHHDGGATLRRHYLAPGAEESAAAARVGRILVDRDPLDADERPEEIGSAMADPLGTVAVEFN